MQPYSLLAEAPRRAESFERKSERERDRRRRNLGGIVGAERMGWGPKRYVGFWYKIHVPNAIFADFFVSWAGFCGESSQGA